MAARSRRAFRLVLLIVAVVAVRLIDPFRWSRGPEADSRSPRAASAATASAPSDGSSPDAEGIGPGARLPTSRPAPSERVLRIEGRVVDLAYAGLSDAVHPSGGVRVALSARRSRFFPNEALHEAEVRTDPEGAFAFRFDDPGVRPLQVGLQAEGNHLYRTAWESPTLEFGRTSVEGIELRRAAHGALEGETVDADGRPLEGVVVSFPPEKQGDPPDEAVSGAKGRFRIGVLRHV